MTTTNKQRRAQHLQRVKDRQAVDAAAIEAQRIAEIRADCLRQLVDAGLTETDLARLERTAEHRRVPLTWLVANVIEERRQISVPARLRDLEPTPDPYFTPGDTFTFSTQPPKPTVRDLPSRRRLSTRNPALLSLIALSLLGSSPRG